MEYFIRFLKHTLVPNLITQQCLRATIYIFSTKYNVFYYLIDMLEIVFFFKLNTQIVNLLNLI